jgi:hypothetical protein
VGSVNDSVNLPSSVVKSEIYDFGQGVNCRCNKILLVFFFTWSRVTTAYVVSAPRLPKT